MILVSRLRALLAAATPGEWIPHHKPWRQSFATCERQTELFVCSYERGADLELVVALRNAAPSLLDEIERLRAKLGEAADALERSAIECRKLGLSETAWMEEQIAAECRALAKGEG